MYGLLLYGVFAAINFSVLKRASMSPMNAMGAGREMFMVLIFLRIIGIYLFLPAMTAGLITQEKERDSLLLLFLTELKPCKSCFKNSAGDWWRSCRSCSSGCRSARSATPTAACRRNSYSSGFGCFFSHACKWPRSR